MFDGVVLPVSLGLTAALSPSPVKVLRLICRDTAEEVILRRAEAKLSLTSTVIEGGQFSHGAGEGAGSSQQLVDILKYGLDRLLQSEEG